MKIITLDLPKMHQGQEKLDREASRFNVVSCGRRPFR